MLKEKKASQTRSKAHRSVCHQDAHDIIKAHVLMTPCRHVRESWRSTGPPSNATFRHTRKLHRSCETRPCASPAPASVGGSAAVKGVSGSCATGGTGPSLGAPNVTAVGLCGAAGRSKGNGVSLSCASSSRELEHAPPSTPQAAAHQIRRRRTRQSCPSRERRRSCGAGSSSSKQSGGAAPRGRGGQGRACGSHGGRSKLPSLGEGVAERAQLAVDVGAQGLDAPVHLLDQALHQLRACTGVPVAG